MIGSHLEHAVEAAFACVKRRKPDDDVRGRKRTIVPVFVNLTAADLFAVRDESVEFLRCTLIGLRVRLMLDEDRPFHSCERADARKVGHVRLLSIIDA
jgi:hypothetical protein